MPSLRKVEEGKEKNLVINLTSPVKKNNQWRQTSYRISYWTGIATAVAQALLQYGLHEVTANKYIGLYVTHKPLFLALHDRFHPGGESARAPS